MGKSGVSVTVTGVPFLYILYPMNPTIATSSKIINTVFFFIISPLKNKTSSIKELVCKRTTIHYYKAIDKLTVLGGRHFSSLQVWYSSLPVTLVFAFPLSFTFCTKTTLLLYWLAETPSFLSVNF